MKTKAPPARKKAPIRLPGTRIGHLTVMDATDQRKNRYTGKWVARITFQGKEHYLGEYLSKADAIKARERAEDMFRDFLRENGRDVPERDDGT